MQKLIAYASQFDPNFPTKIRGASRPGIDALAELVGAPLPTSYEKFLEYFGEADGGLALAFDGSTDLPDLLDFYRDYVRSGETVLPAGCLAIGIDAMTEEAICLQGEGVVFTGEGNVRGGYADSLEKLLYRTVTLKLRSAFLGRQKIYFGSGQEMFAPTVAIAERLGFQGAWFSDAFVFCGERGESILNVIRYEGQPLSLHFSCREDAEFNAIDRMVADEFGWEARAVQES